MIDFENSLPMILNRALDAIMPQFRELFARHDLTEQQWRILRVLWMRKKVTTKQLAELTLLPAPSLVGVIDRLEKKSLVERIRSTADRRIVYVTPTPKGQELEEEVMPHVALIQDNIKSTVSEKDWMSMQKTLEKIASHALERSEENNNKSNKS